MFELDSFTTSPPAGAGPDRVNVPTTPVVELPCTVDGLNETDSNSGIGWMVNVACLDAVL